jgi:hypothetical protein
LRTGKIWDSFGSEQEAEEQRQPTAFDVLTSLVLPLVIVIIAQMQEQRLRFWALLGFAALSLTVGFYKSGMTLFGTALTRWRHGRVARKHFPEFKCFVRRFGEFVDTGRSDTLQQIVLNDLCRGSTATSETLRRMPVQLFINFYYHLRARADATRQEKPTTFVRSLTEFNNLVTSYTQYCVEPVFNSMPTELRNSLTPDIRGNLELFRERFARFLDDYESYLKEFADSGLRGIQPYLPRPKPL